MSSKERFLPADVIKKIVIHLYIHWLNTYIYSGTIVNKIQVKRQLEVIYPIIQETYIKGLLYAKHCSRLWGFVSLVGHTA